MALGNRFEPNSLPDTGHRGVPYPLRAFNLLSSRLVATVGRIPHPNLQHIITLCGKRLCDIDAEGGETALVGAHLHIVNPHVTLPVNGAEIQHHIFPFP